MAAWAATRAQPPRPGPAGTPAVTALLLGATISGVMRLIETILWAAALALGFALAGWLLGV